MALLVLASESLLLSLIKVLGIGVSVPAWNPATLTEGRRCQELLLSPRLGSRRHGFRSTDQTLTGTSRHSPRSLCSVPNCVRGTQDGGASSHPSLGSCREADSTQGSGPGEAEAVCLFIIPHTISESLPRTGCVPGPCGGPCPVLPAATQDPLAEAGADVVDTGSLEGGCPTKAAAPAPWHWAFGLNRSEISSGLE